MEQHSEHVNQILDVAMSEHMNYLLLNSMTDIIADERLQDSIKATVYHSVSYAMLQSKTVAELQNLFEELKINHQFMKGTILKQVYLSPFLREMSDIDIFVDERDLERAQHALEREGYVLYKKVHNHVMYYKMPSTLIELHWSFFDIHLDQKQSVYYDQKSVRSLVNGTQYTYEFSREDYYCYMISHIAKHFYKRGCGIRNLVDIYVYTQKYRLNKSVLQGNLEILGLTAFERNLKAISVDWIEGNSFSEFEYKLFYYMLDSGVYGKDANGLWNDYSKLSKETSGKSHIKLWFIFPPYSYMAKYYAYLKKHKILLPIAWLHRAIKGIFNHKSEEERRDMIYSTEANQVENIKEIYRTMHLEFQEN